jgi:hypothetical protein
VASQLAANRNNFQGAGCSTSDIALATASPARPTKTAAQPTTIARGCACAYLQTVLRVRANDLTSSTSTSLDGDLLAELAPVVIVPAMQQVGAVSFDHLVGAQYEFLSNW